MGDGLFSKFKELIGVEEVEEMTPEVVRTAASQPSQRVQVSGTRASYTSERVAGGYTQPRAERRESKVVSMQNAGSKQFKLLVNEPECVDDCQRIMDDLKNRKPVVVNLERANGESKRRIVDTLSGTVYALNGKVSQVSNDIFIFAPDNVDILQTTDIEKKSGKLNSNPWLR